MKSADRQRVACEFIDHEGIGRKIRTYFELGMHLYLIGPPGIGKTTLVEDLAGGPENLVTIVGTKMTTSDLVGSKELDGDRTYWRDGLLVHAMRAGKTFYLDESEEMPPKCASLLHQLLDHRLELTVTGNSETVTAHPRFRFILSDNYSSSGISAHTRQFRDRLVCIHMNRLDRETETKLLIDRHGIDADDAEWLLTFAAATRRADKHGGASTRQLDKAAESIVAGINRKQAALDCILTPIAGNSRQQHERLFNAIRAEGLDLEGVWQTPTSEQFDDLEYVANEA